MNKRTRAWILALVAIFAMALVGAHSASARALAAPIPPVKQPASARFDLAGNISLTGLGSSTLPINDIKIQISGSGAMSGNDLQEDVVVKIPDSPQSAGVSSELKASTILLGQKLYFKSTGLTPGTEDKWYVTDLGTLPIGSQSLSGSPLAGLDPKLAAAFTVTMSGKETISGGLTTKYRVDVDLKKLLESAGGSGATTDADTEKALANTKLMFFMWVGDNNMYLYQARVTLDSKIDTPDAPDAALALDFTITYKDFDLPVTITAPANAEPLDLGAGAGALGGLVPGVPGNVGSLVGMSGAIPGMPSSIPGMPTISGLGGSIAGMPRTGSSDQTGLILVLGAGVVLLIVGGFVRLRSGRAMDDE